MRKKILVFLSFSLLLGLAAFGANAYYRAALRRPGPGSEKPREFVIQSGESVAEIAKSLKEKELINSEFLFKVYLFLNNLGPTLEAGEYQILGNLTIPQLVKRLQHGTFDLKLTFIEGWRREEMAAYAAEKSKMFEEKFLGASEGMEGYLFPDTYLVPNDFSHRDLVALLRRTFDEKCEELLAQAKDIGLSRKEAVILASLVEREARREEDRPKVADVLFKRYKNDLPLEVDATVQFALANKQKSKTSLALPCRQAGGRQVKDQRSKIDWWPEVIKKNLEIDSPYNTYKYKGLPPAAICNPGLSALSAVIKHEKTSYWYYVSDKRGEIHFSKTLDEHNHNVLKYYSQD